MNETELLFSEALHCDRASLYLNKNIILEKDKSFFISSVLKRRILGEPIQYILGRTEFAGLEFKVNKDVFIPRPETEVLVEAVLKIVGSFVPARPAGGRSPVKILDIGTGSGCIAVSLAKLLANAFVTATDISQPALEIALDNAVSNNVADKIRFVHSDLFTTYDLQLMTYNLIVSNPPYIPRREIKTLQPEISYEPYLALDGGDDGLDFYRRIIADSARYLEKKGILILEIGFGQKESIKNILQKNGNFGIIDIIKDYTGIDRVIVAGLCACK